MTIVLVCYFLPKDVIIVCNVLYTAAILTTVFHCLTFNSTGVHENGCYIAKKEVVAVCLRDVTGLRHTIDEIHLAITRGEFGKS